VTNNTKINKLNKQIRARLRMNGNASNVAKHAGQTTFITR